MTSERFDKTSASGGEIAENQSRSIGQGGFASIQVRVKYLRDAKQTYENIDADVCGLACATPWSAGVDLRACCEEESVRIPAGERFAFPTGIAIEPAGPGVAGFVYSRSGLGTRKGLTVSQGVGVIDPDYRGEIIVSLLNTSGEERVVSNGERIAQLIFQPYFQPEFEVVEELGKTDRGEGGFGHTGSK